ncbi:flavin reductase [Leucobacter soli]|uniref:FMN reductase (NADH) RutF n=1 Tax=Leucobacter soli TaxID=2812850 RepID=A0A916NVX8_9MICO|nr:flavin reductase [Leucobacter soli]CAG7612173.1 FMN reductase (NADH) RutF [Leucobacter soli]
MTTHDGGTRAPETTRRDEKSAWWRAVLGEYPTGVALITSRTDAGEDFGLVVGTFMAVSEDPPLIGFMPATSSRRAAMVKANGTFCVNVLGYGHEQLCRAVAGSDPDAFQYGRWDRSPLGNLRLADSLSWFEGRIEQVVPAGDHEIVIAGVEGLGIGDGRSGMPLLFLKGGYGSFSVPNEEFDLAAFALRMRVAGAIGEIVQHLADDLGLECLLATIVDDAVIVLSAANLLPMRPRDGLVGMVFPFAAPISPVLAAWGDEARQKAWHEHARHLLGRVDRPLLARLLAGVRERGYAISAGERMGLDFDAITHDPASTRADLSRLWAAVSADVERTLDAGVDDPGVFSLQFPVLNASGRVEFELVVSGFEPGVSRRRLDHVIAQSQRAAEQLSELVGARFPGTPA